MEERRGTDGNGNAHKWEAKETGKGEKWTTGFLKHIFGIP